MMKRTFSGRTYHIGDLAVPVMAVDEEQQTVCLKVGTTEVWVKAADIMTARPFWRDRRESRGASLA